MSKLDPSTVQVYRDCVAHGPGAVCPQPLHLHHNPGSRTGVRLRLQSVERDRQESLLHLRVPNHLCDSIGREIIDINRCTFIFLTKLDCDADPLLPHPHPAEGHHQEDQEREEA